MSDRRCAAPLVSKQWNVILKNNPDALAEDRASVFFKHRNQKWIVQAFGSHLVGNLPVLDCPNPFNEATHAQTFQSMQQLGTRMAIGKTSSADYSRYGLVLIFPTWTECNNFVEKLYGIRRPNSLSFAPLSEADQKEICLERSTAISQVIASRQLPISPSQEPAGYFFMKCFEWSVSAPVNNQPPPRQP